MELKIGEGSLIKNVQIEFNAVYFYLKINFFILAVHFQNIFKIEKINYQKPVRVQERFNKSGIINIDNKRTVVQLEYDFETTFGLSIKLFRKSGNSWIETTLTENWTLEKQNEEGEFMSSPDHKQSIVAHETDEWPGRE